MPKILSIGTAVPPYEINQQEAKAFSRKMFQDHYKDIERLLKIFHHTQIDKRYFCVPKEWFDKEHTFEEKNELYIKNAITLTKSAIKAVLSATPFHTEAIDHVIFVSSTGISTPSIDAYLYNEPEIHFKASIKRTPIWGLGCAGGAAGLSRAYEYTLAFPKKIVLLLAVEIGELAFLHRDFSKSNFIATSLFGDGAAAVLVAGDEVKIPDSSPVIQVIDSQSTIWKESLDMMGWSVKNDGFKVIFSKDIPSLIRQKLKSVTETFLQKHNLSFSAIDYFVLHPGGTKVIEAYEEIFNLSQEQTHASKNILRQYGNMSSPTVLFVLDYIVKNIHPTDGIGLLLALGPGFSAEMLLIKWD